MPDFENQLRTQITKQLTEKTSQLAKVQTVQKNLTNEIAGLKSKLAKFDEVFSDTSTPKVRRKPGPKPKATKAVTAAKTAEPKVRRKPGPKPKAVKAAAKSPKAPKAAKATKTRANNLATQGRRAVAQGLRPPIKKAMIEVMGKKTTNATEIYEGLKAKDWLPNSNDPRAYISYLLSSFKDVFERVEGKGRGQYRVRDGVTTTTTKTTKKTEATAEATSTSSDVDEVLKEAGVIPASAPAN